MAPSDISSVYRQASIGRALIDSLDAMVADGKLSPQQAAVILQTFDKSVPKAFAKERAGPAALPNIAMNGTIVRYNACEDIWRFQLTKAKLTITHYNGEQTTLLPDEDIKVVAVPTKLGDRLLAARAHKHRG